MDVTARDGTRISVRDTGEGPVTAFSSSLGTDGRMWDGVIDRLPNGRHLTYDMRGHGASDVASAPYSMGQLVSDAEAVLDGNGVTDCTFVGCSVGGMVGLALAVKRPDLIARLVVSNTAARIGNDAAWDARIDAVRAGGMAAIADMVLERWFSRDFRAGPDFETWRERLLAVDPEGYVGVCAAIRGTDLLTPASGLSLPVLVIAGSEDGATPPDLVRETAEAIHGARFELIPRVGHLPPVEAPDRVAELTASLG